jgi:hypothetical protein
MFRDSVELLLFWAILNIATRRLIPRGPEAKYMARARWYPWYWHLNKYNAARIIYVLIQIVAMIATLYILLGTILHR